MKKKLKLSYSWHQLESAKLLRIMKISFFLLLIVLLPVTATGYSQKKTFNFSEQGITIREFFKKIESNSNFRFFYNDQVVNIDQKVNLTADNKNISDILDNLFQGTNLTYKILENNLIVVSTIALLQQVKVTGKVTDATTGESLPGVNIIVENTSNGAVSDVNGNYTIDINNNEAILVFSFIGYNTERISVLGKTKIDVTLIPEIKALDEIVVVGYGQSSRKKLASAVTSVASGDLNMGAITDVGQMLQGKVPGLNISASGDPNRPAAVILRGASTINSSQTPFYVIDNIPGADISTVSMDDIASIDVLKDAAATSIYGNRAANGVIMVTTKKGKQGQMQISYHGYVGFEQVSNQLDMMDANQLRAFVETNKLSFSSDDDLSANTNWQKAVERNTAISTSHNLSFSGGTEMNNYSASLTYLNKEGILFNSNLSRIIARLSVEQYAFNKNVKFGLTVSNSNSKETNVPQRNVVLLQSVKYLPVSPIYNEDGTYFENFTNTNYFNPLAISNHGQDDSKYNYLVAGFTAHAKLPFGFTYDLNLSYQNKTSLHGEFYDSYYKKYNSAGFYNNPDPPSTHIVLNFGENGSALRSSYQDYSTIIENYITWDKKIGEHSVNAVLGYSWQNNVYGDGFQATSTNFPIDAIGYNNLALSNYSSVSGYKVNFGSDGVYQETRMISDFARVNYNYKSKYLLQVSVRRDGSSVFGEDHQWGYFPSVGVAWRISDEGFMKNFSAFNDLKLRASYGEAGNSSGFGAYTAQFISGSLGTYYYNGSQIGAYGPTQAANADLHWEKTSTTNIGLDFTILGGFVSGSFEWYNKKTTGMIFGYGVDPIKVPTGSITANGGSMSNKGIEISLTVKPVNNKNFRWVSEINLAHNENLITSLTNPLFSGGDSVLYTQPDGSGQTGSTLQIRKSGKPLGQFFTLEYAGKNEGGVSQYVNHNGELSTSTSIGVDYHYAGSPQPKILLGWSNSFNYKNFDLNVFVRGVFGNKIFNATRADLFRPATAYSSNILVDAANESPKDGNVFKYSTRFIEDGSYVRLDNATLGYNFKNPVKYMQSLRLYVTGNNLFVITGYKGTDPEVNQGGMSPGVDSNNFYPKTRTVLFGVNVLF